MTAQRWGVEAGYRDAGKTWHDVDPSVAAQIVRSMGGDALDGPPQAERPAWFVRPGEARQLESRCHLSLEDGTSVGEVEALPPDLPLGYHALDALDGTPLTQLIVSPGHCHLPDDLFTWGWAVQLYAARSRASWGIGDLSNLARLAEWSATLGAGALAVNPLHGVGPALPQETSPYFPSSRRFLSPLYIAVPNVPGAGKLLGPELDTLAAAGHALNSQRRIDRDQVWALKRRALQAIFDVTVAPAPPSPIERDPATIAFATYCAIADIHGNFWTKWPADLRHPDSSAVARFRSAHPTKVRFYAWLQDQLAIQREAARRAGVDEIGDLAVGFDPAGFDAWQWQDLLALDMRVGAPPDEFNTAGQNWGLPPFVPWKLAAANYGPFIDTLRSVLGSASGTGGLRIDHVMGLFRLFWIPEGSPPDEGGYVRYPSKELLDILALESHRASTYVIGEDLGTVETSTREELVARRLLSYKLLWFESDPPEEWRVDALAAVTTHDLPTIAGVWTGADGKAQRQAGLEPKEASEAEVKDRLSRTVDVEDKPELDEVIAGAYEALARAPSLLVTATLDDALGVEERPNMPGSGAAWPNWCLALPIPLEEIETDRTVATVAGTLAARSRR